jgi:hypothetical protein
MSNKYYKASARAQAADRTWSKFYDTNDEEEVYRVPTVHFFVWNNGITSQETRPYTSTEDISVLFYSSDDESRFWNESSNHIREYRMLKKMGVPAIDCLSAFPGDEPPSPSPYTTATAVCVDELREAVIKEDEFSPHANEEGNDDSTFQMSANEHFVEQMNHSRMIYSLYTTPSNESHANEEENDDSSFQTSANKHFVEQMNHSQMIYSLFSTPSNESHANEEQNDDSSFQTSANEHFVEQMNHSQMIYSLYSTPSNESHANEEENDDSSFQTSANEHFVEQMNHICSRMIHSLYSTPSNESHANEEENDVSSFQTSANEHFVEQMNHSRMIYSRYSTSSNAEDAAEDFSSLSEDACEIVVDQTSVAKKKKKKTRMMRELESSLDGRYWKVVRQSRR